VGWGQGLSGYNVLHYCIVLYCTVLYCIVLQEGAERGGGGEGVFVRRQEPLLPWNPKSAWAPHTTCASSTWTVLYCTGIPPEGVCVAW